jgi:hypothetical protein
VTLIQDLFDQLVIPVITMILDARHSGGSEYLSAIDTREMRYIDRAIIKRYTTSSRITNRILLRMNGRLLMTFANP